MNTPPKPLKSMAGKPCRHCQQGTFELVQITHVENVAQDNPLTIPDVWVDRCNHCGEIIFPGDTVHFIESVVAEQTEQLTGRELERIREDLGVETQDEMSEVLGLGTKTYHKWESDAQYPTRSMSYYIRVLAAFPDAFAWLRQRKWRSSNRVASGNITADFSIMFPDLDVSEGQPLPTPGRIDRLSVSNSQYNPARGLNRVAFASK